jgi:hypothetical protein
VIDDFCLFVGRVVACIGVLGVIAAVLRWCINNLFKAAGDSKAVVDYWKYVYEKKHGGES